MEIKDYIELAEDNYRAAKEISSSVRYGRHTALMCYLAVRPYMQAVCFALVPDCLMEETKTLMDMFDIFMDYGISFSLNKDALRAMDASYSILIEQEPEESVLEPGIAHDDIIRCMSDIKSIVTDWYSGYIKNADDRSTVSDLLKRAEG